VPAARHSCRKRQKRQSESGLPFFTNSCISGLFFAAKLQRFVPILVPWPVDILADFIDLAPQFAPFIRAKTAGTMFRVVRTVVIIALFETVSSKRRAFSLLMGPRLMRRCTMLRVIRFRNCNETAQEQNHRQQSLSDTHHKFVFSRT
jgi:hypothetical protein